MKKIYLVGGAVRDELLGLPVRERDWVVVGATPDEMLTEGYLPADPAFPVFLHSQTREEYALARREKKAGPGYRGFEVDAGPGITLEQDLARRDLTINAMARDENDVLIDPFDGQQDLEERLLRHVTPAFSEDPVRLLRIARFAARLGGLGFRVAHSTHQLMKQMVADGAVAELQPQRIWQEMIKAMACEQPWRFIEVLHACGALRELLPGLAQEMSSGHTDSRDGVPIAALKAATMLTGDPELRTASLLLQSPDAPAVMQSQPGPSRRVMDLVTVSRSLWPLIQQLDELAPEQLEALLHDMGGWRQGGRFTALLLIFQAQPGVPELVSSLAGVRERALSIDVDALRADGLQGADLGRAIKMARVDAIRAVRE